MGIIHIVCIIGCDVVDLKKDGARFCCRYARVRQQNAQQVQKAHKSSAYSEHANRWPTKRRGLFYSHIDGNSAVFGPCLRKQVCVLLHIILLCAG